MSGFLKYFYEDLLLEFILANKLSVIIPGLYSGMISYSWASYFGSVSFISLKNMYS